MQKHVQADRSKMGLRSELGQSIAGKRRRLAQAWCIRWPKEWMLLAEK